MNFEDIKSCLKRTDLETSKGLVIPQWNSLKLFARSNSYCLGNCFVLSVKLFLQMRPYFELFIEK